LDVQTKRFGIQEYRLILSRVAPVYASQMAAGAEAERCPQHPLNFPKGQFEEQALLRAVETIGTVTVGTQQAEINEEDALDPTSRFFILGEDGLTRSSLAEAVEPSVSI
jgi:hypothetical protein